MKSFKDKVAVITGAGSGIGRALAKALAAQGSKLVLSDIVELSLEETAEICRKNTEVLVQKTNVAKREEIVALAQSTINHFGEVDMVFNNAGIALGKKPITQISYEELEKIIDIDLWGVIYGTKEFLPHLLKRPEAVIVNISSAFGLAGIAEQVPYCTTKFAVRGFTEALRMELIGTSVEAYCVHPGGINTNIVKNALDEAQTESERKALLNFQKLLKIPADQAAQVILKGIRRGNKKILIGQDAMIFDFSTRVFPENYSGVINYLSKKLLS